ncbi:MAG TPA: hypothetical protein VMN57_00845 [Anaerolineales bacterium]|nr:hypothetical protein [Anaerolineales bacterium]
MRYLLVPILLVVFCAALVLPNGSASAHFIDSDLVMDEVPVGPYRLSVWTVADVTGGASMHITSRLSDPATGGPVAAAKVRYVIRDLQGLQTEIICDASPATPLNGFIYEGDVPLDEYGSYRITVEISDPQDLLGEASYVFPVYPFSKAVQVMVSVLLVIGLLATAWILREGYLIFVKKRSSI